MLLHLLPRRRCLCGTSGRSFPFSFLPVSYDLHRIRDGTPGRYVGAEQIEDDDEPFDEKMKRLVAQLEEQFAEGARLEQEIRKNLRGLGYAE